MTQVRPQGAKYSFSDRGVVTTALVLFSLALGGVAYFVVTNGIQGASPLGAALILALTGGAVYSAYAVTFPSKMIFYGEFIKIGDRRTRKVEDIPYKQITKVDVIREDSRYDYSYDVAFYVSGRAKPYEVPKTFKGGGMNGAKSSEAMDFANWLRDQAGLPREESKAPSEARA